jgi:hypothetical protein
MVPYGEFLFADWYSCNCVQSKKRILLWKDLMFDITFFFKIDFSVPHVFELFSTNLHLTPPKIRYILEEPRNRTQDCCRIGGAAT